MSMQVDPPLPLVLVAHRSPDTVELLKALLERGGYTTLCAYNGRSALQYAHQHRPILLLLDQALPLIDGLELCRTLRQEEDGAAIFILSDQSDELGKLLASDRTVVLYNEAARRLCGWSADQIIGQVKCYSLLSCHDEEGRMLCNNNCILRTGTLSPLDKSGSYGEQTTRYRIILKDGREVPAIAHYSNLGAEDGYILLTLEPDLASMQLP